MKRILLSLFLLVSFSANAEILQNIGSTGGGGTFGSDTVARNKADANALDIESLIASQDDPLAERLMASANKERAITWIVSGDSTRENTYNKMREYYEKQFAKIGVSVFYNSRSGQTGYDWANQVDALSVSSDVALAEISGTGKDHILEFSWGINDMKVTPQNPNFSVNDPVQIARVKADLQFGITKFVTAKPDLVIVLVTPTYTANLPRNTALQTVYQELAIENNLLLVDIVDDMGFVHSDPNLYFDPTHPSRNGSRRLVNLITDKVVPTSLKWLMTLDDYPNIGVSQNTGELYTQGNYESGYWASANGIGVTISSWRRSTGFVAVEPNFTVKIQHLGNRTDVHFYTEAGVWITKSYTSSVAGEAYRIVTVPAGAYKMRFNIGSSSVTPAYDALGDVPSVKYDTTPTNNLSVEEINVGLDLLLPRGFISSTVSDTPAPTAPTASKSIAVFDGISAEIRLPKVYTLADDGDYIEFVSRLNDKEETSALGLFGLFGDNTNMLGYSSSNNRFMTRNDGGALANLNMLNANINTKDFHRYRVTQASATAWTISVDGVDIGMTPRTSFLSIDSVGAGYIGQFVKASVAEFEIVTAGTGNFSIKDMKKELAEKHLGTDVTVVELDYAEDDVVVHGTNIQGQDARLFIYVRQANKDKAVVYRYRHMIAGSIAADIWKIDGSSMVDVVEFPLIYNNARPITTTGSPEWENAIRITADDDFVGGRSHGKDETYANGFTIDGVQQDLNTHNIATGKNIKFTQSSELYRKVGGDYRAINVASSDRTWTFTKEKLNIRNEVTWKTAESISIAYLTMMPAIRSDASGTLTEWGLWGDTPVNVDISQPGFTSVFSNNDTLGAWGEDSNLSIKVVVKDGWNANSKSHISNSTIYNKFYFDYSGSQVTSIGQVMVGDADYFIKVK